MKILTLEYQDGKIKLSDSDKPLKMGRSELNDLVFYHPTVSDRHGQIFLKDAHFVYQDLGSKNGSILMDGQKNSRFLKNESQTINGAGNIFLGSRSGPVLKFTVEDISSENVLDIADDINFLFEQALSNLRIGEYQSSFKKFEALVQRFPREMDFYYYAGFSAWKLNRLDEAALRFEQYLMIRTEDLRVMTDLGKIYERQGEIDKARQWYGKAACKGKPCPEAETLLRNLERLRGYGSPLTTRHKTVELLKTPDRSVNHTPHFSASYLCDHLDMLKDILKDLEIAYQNVGKFLDFYPDHKINVKLVPDVSEPRGRTGKNGIVLYVSAYHHQMEKRFLSVLAGHEYSHYALGCLTRFSRTVPWWIHEGFAQIMSQNMTPDRLLDLKAQDQNRLLPDLDSLMDVPREFNRADMNTAYLISHGAVTFLVKNQPPGKLPALIRAFVKTANVETAFASINLDYLQFKKQTTKWLFTSARNGTIKQTQNLF